MANFNFTVDTKPMADSIDGVAHHVDGTTAAVVAMQTAVVIAEQKGAEKICNNVNFGFILLSVHRFLKKLQRTKVKRMQKLWNCNSNLFHLLQSKAEWKKITKCLQAVTQNYLRD